MVNADLQRRFRWFLPRVGGIVGQTAQTALALARAEQWLNAQDDIHCEWRDDPDGDLGDHAYWCALERNGQHRKHSHVIEWARLVRECPEHHDTDCRHAETLASLGSIIDADNAYRRIVAAELALEAMP
jgi:hypothetical protein